MKKYRRLLGGLLVAAQCFFAFPMSAKAESGECIRIGMYNKDNYHIIDDHDRHSGYDHEYLLEIAKYTGWEYERVEGTWQECINMLINGEIDLLGGVGWNEDWDICYAEEASALSSNCLLISEDSEAYAFEDFDAFDGIKIGILKDSAIDRDLKVYAEKNHFSYQLMQYETEDDLNEAMRKGKIDCLGLSDFRNLSRYKIIARIGDTPLYYATSPNRSDLKTELDKALEKIHQENKFYEAQLYDKYFNSAHRIAFSQEELEYLQEHQTIQVALFPEIPQVCECDVASGEYGGFIFQILDLLSEETGITFEYMEMPDDVIPWDFLYDHPNVLLAPLFQNNLIHYSERMRFSNTIVPGKMIAVTNEKTISEVVNKSGTFKLAIPQGMFGASQELKQLFPTSELVLCDSHEEGMEMVRRGQADMTIVNEILGGYLMQSPYYRNLNTGYLNQVMENVTLGMGSSSDMMLMSILNKVIRSFGQSDIQRIVMEYTADHPYRKDMGEQIYENWPTILILLLAVIFVGILLYFYEKQRKVWTEQKVQFKVTEEKLKTEEKYQRELFQRANFDHLTGLYSPQYFYEKAEELQRENPDVVYTFFFINISEFKMINELYGTEQGDEILRETARQLKMAAGEEQLVSRIYGDQFVMCRTMEQKQIEQLPDAQTLFYFQCGKKTIRVQVKIGVYINERCLTEAAQATTYARIALQNHRGSTGNYIYLYRQEYMDRMLLSQTLTNEMETALQEGQFQVYYQPQYDIKSGKLVSAEALARWLHPHRGMIPPGVFIPVFEMNGFATQLDLFIFETVCRKLAEWRKNGVMIPVSSNLSRLDLQNTELLPRLKKCIETYDIPAQYLHLEITESAYVEDHGVFYKVIEELRRTGFVIEMDDFGSGYSSLNMLKDIPVDVLKLDMKFFGEETNMDRGGSIVEAVVRLAHELGILVVAEGVETEREANFLLSVQCHIVQGYLYGRPMPEKEFEQLLVSDKTGEKMRKLLPDVGAQTESRYWEIEQLNILLHHSGGIMMDYDPVGDYARFVSGEETEEGKMKEIPDFMKNLKQNLRIHPDFEVSVREAMTCTVSTPTELTFMADRYGTGSFEWFHGTLYHYCTEGRLNRVLALIVRTGSDTPEI